MAENFVEKGLITDGPYIVIDGIFGLGAVTSGKLVRIAIVADPRARIETTRDLSIGEQDEQFVGEITTRVRDFKYSQPTIKVGDMYTIEFLSRGDDLTQFRIIRLGEGEEISVVHVPTREEAKELIRSRRCY